MIGMAARKIAKHRNRSAHTRAPVTVSGWYEHSDGTIGHYVWRGGNLVLDQVVPSWSDVESAKSEALSLPPMNYAGGKRTAKRSSNRAGTKRRATKKTANKAGKRRNRAGSGSVTTKKLRDMGYTCHLETVKGQGYFGGDGVQAYRVRDPQGKLVNYPISTHRTARAAWEEAADRVQSGR